MPWPSGVPAALQTAGAWLREELDIHPHAAVGHRVVHGGPDFDRPVISLTPDVLARLESYVSLAPLHQPHLAPIRSILAHSPDLPQVACFDTAFHRGHTAVVDHYAIPERFMLRGCGDMAFMAFHMNTLPAGCRRWRRRSHPANRVIVAHLGSGASMCALAGGRSIESTMGFTALNGLPMGTRPGQINPGSVLHLIWDRRMSAPAGCSSSSITSAEIERLFGNKKEGGGA